MGRLELTTLRSLLRFFPEASRVVVETLPQAGPRRRICEKAGHFSLARISHGADGSIPIQAKGCNQRENPQGCQISTFARHV